MQYVQSGIVQSAAEYGVKGYLLKSDNLSLNLSGAILAVSRGALFISEAVSRERFGTGRKPAENLLTARQCAVILSITKRPDDSYAQTARRLDISENTLKGQLRSAFAQLGVTNITSCIIHCMQLNRIPFTVNPGGKGIQFGEQEDLLALTYEATPQGGPRSTASSLSLIEPLSRDHLGIERDMCGRSYGGVDLKTMSHEANNKVGKQARLQDLAG